jgi:hypothetical protein
MNNFVSQMNMSVLSTFIPVSLIVALVPLFCLGLMVLVNSSLVRVCMGVLLGKVEVVDTLSTFMAEKAVKDAVYMRNLYQNISAWVKARKDDVVVLSEVVFWVTAYSMQALAKGIAALAIGTVTIVIAALCMPFIVAYKAGKYTATTAATTYRKVRTSVKASVLNWLGVTAEINQLKRENAKLEYSVRRLEIIAGVDMPVVVDRRQEEANEMAQTLDAEFRAQLDALDASDLIGVWMGLDLGDSIASGQFTRDMVTDEIMERIPMDRSAAMQAVRQ